ncbi:MAG: hypothetical protein B1H12_07975 [Desulfobacteraceae bacterium 4484_190.2]|nr:MAG: hypothetical protein B1H12_07975 [Desulfobacteraceae bacterium 4484_190.2]
MSRAGQAGVGSRRKYYVVSLYSHLLEKHHNPLLFFADIGYPSPKIRIPLFLDGYINSQHKASFL